MIAKVFITTAVAGMALAAPQPAPEPIIEVLEVRQILSQVVNAASSLAGPATTFAGAVTSAGAQATSALLPSDLSACTVPSSILSIIEDAPSPPADLISAIATITNPCAKPSFTGKISSEYDSYSKAVVTWASSLSSWQSDYRKNCPIATSLSLTSNAAVCSTAAAAGSSGASGSAGSASASGAASSGNSTNAAGRQNHAAAGFAAVAGFAGVLALL